MLYAIVDQMWYINHNVTVILLFEIMHINSDFVYTGYFFLRSASWTKLFLVTEFIVIFYKYAII